MNGLPGMRGVKVFTGAAAAVLLLACVGPVPALADTIEAALVRAYQNNPQLNAQRAAGALHRRERAAGAVGLSPEGRGHRQRRLSIHRHATPPRAARRPRSCAPKSTAPTRRAASALTVTQTLFNGQQTANRTRAAESQVSGAREALARARTDRAAVGRHDLHGLSARLPRSSRFRRATFACSSRR